MRTLIFLIAVLLLLALVGWISFTSNPGRSSINLETQEIKEDTQHAVDSGAQLLNDAEESIRSSDAEPETEPIVEPTPPAVDAVPATAAPEPTGSSDTVR